ncbi:MAG: hypothetical protein AAB486_01180 [Patescibacteria group bacterium]
MPNKGKIKQISINGNVTGLKKEIEELKRHLNGVADEIHAVHEEITKSESKIKSELFKQTNDLEKTLKVNMELSDLRSRAGMRAEMEFVVERSAQKTLEQMRKDKMDILGSVSDFGKRTSSTEDAQNILSSRVEDHEERLTKLEEA